MRAVNLMPREVERQHADIGRAPIVAAVVGLALVTVAAGFLVMSASGSASDRKAQLDTLEASMAALPAPGRPAVAAGTVAQERTDRVAALAAAMATRVPVDRLLRDLAYVLPEDAWLTSLTATAPTSGAAAPGPGGSAPAQSSTSGVSIQGATYSHTSVARVLARLAALPTLTNVRLTSSALVETSAPTDATGKKATKQKPVIAFTITAGIGGGAS
jgi:Tfp pilus assembly protein PilN